MSNDPYARSRAQKAHDFENSRKYEQHVADKIGGFIVTKFTSNDDLDIWQPGYYLEIKEKNQHYTKRWQLLHDVPEEFLFIMDELTVRRALRHYPEVFFLIKDNLNDRIYFTPIWELVGVERIRVNRNGKGKWIIDLRNFGILASEEWVPEIAAEALSGVDWKKSHCISQKVIPEI